VLYAYPKFFIAVKHPLTGAGLAKTLLVKSKIACQPYPYIGIGIGHQQKIYSKYFWKAPKDR
jgi:hypothetical protein